MGKIFTIAGIVLIFGWFIRESFTDPSSESDPNKIVFSGVDTLGRDWGAIAEQKRKAAAAMYEEAESNNSEKNLYKAPATLLSEDPYKQDKLNSADYSSIESADGREIITGYNRAEDEDAGLNRIRTRHQKEKGQQPSE